MLYRRVVVDPPWRSLDREAFCAAWGAMEREAEECGFVGFDMEWTTWYEPLGSKDPAKQHRCKRRAEPTAVVQLSSRHVTMVLRVSQLRRVLEQGEPVACGDAECVWGKLKALLASDSVYKVGVGIRDDRTKLEADFPGEVEVCGCVDVDVLHRSKEEVACNPLSLKGLREMYTGRTLNKDLLIIRSNWGGSLGGLSPSQIRYAAEDAEASFEVCDAILASMKVDTPSAVRELLQSLVVTRESKKNKGKKGIIRGVAGEQETA